MTAGNGQRKRWASGRAKLLAEEFLTCRFIRHAWNWHGFKTVKIDGKVVVSSESDCACGTVKTELFDSKTGQVLGRTYEYPDGYLVPRDEDARANGYRTLRQDFTVELMRRRRVGSE